MKKRLTAATEQWKRHNFVVQYFLVALVQPDHNYVHKNNLTH